MNEPIKQFVTAHGLQFVAEGLDNAVYADTAHTTAFRFPKKADRVATLRQEAMILPLLSGLGAIVPTPIVKEVDGLVYGEYPFVSGKQYEQLSPAEQIDLLQKLSLFLKALHTFQNPELKLLEENSAPEFLKHPQYVKIPKVLLHADISLDHVYYFDGKIAVIDWSDWHFGDPAYEFHHLLDELPVEQHKILFAYYPAEDDPTFWERAQAYSVE